MPEEEEVALPLALPLPLALALALVRIGIVQDMLFDLTFVPPIRWKWSKETGMRTKKRPRSIDEARFI